MGMFSGLKEAREKSKAIKKDHLSKLAVAAVEDGSYKFYYGFNSNEDYQELEEVIAEINKELKEDKFSIKITGKYSSVQSVYYKKTLLAKYNNCVSIDIDAL